MKKTKSIIGIFDDQDKLINSIDEVQNRGLKIQDVISPFPMHSVFEKLKLNSRIPVLALLYGVFAVITIFAFLYWTSVVDYPLRYGGKPQNTLSFVIVIFVMTINITALFTIITFFLREKKGPGAVAKVVHQELNDDKFALLLKRKDEMTDDEAAEIERYLMDLGAIEIYQKEV
mgnify:CR=1 FL=1